MTVQTATNPPPPGTATPGRGMRLLGWIFAIPVLGGILALFIAGLPGFIVTITLIIVLQTVTGQAKPLGAAALLLVFASVTLLWLRHLTRQGLRMTSDALLIPIPLSWVATVLLLVGLLLAYDEWSDRSAPDARRDPTILTPGQTSADDVVVPDDEDAAGEAALQAPNPPISGDLTANDTAAPATTGDGAEADKPAGPVRLPRLLRP